MPEFLETVKLRGKRFVRDLNHAGYAIGRTPTTHNVAAGTAGTLIGGALAYVSGFVSAVYGLMKPMVDDLDARTGPVPTAEIADIAGPALITAMAAYAGASSALNLHGWRMDAPERAERHTQDRREDLLTTLHRSHHLTSEQQRSRADMMATLRVDEDVAMGRGRAAADNDAHHALQKRFVDELINDAVTNRSPQADGYLFQTPDNNGIKRGLFFTDDRFGTGKPATIIPMSEAAFAYAQDAAISKNVSFPMASDAMLETITEAVAATVAIVASPVFAGDAARRKTALKDETNYVDSILDHAVLSGTNKVNGTLFEEKNNHGIERGIILFDDAFAGGKPNTVIPLTKAGFHYAKTTAAAKNIEFPVQSEQPIRDILRQNGRTEDFTVHPLEAAFPARASRSADANEERKEQAASSASAIPAPRRSLRIATQHEARAPEQKEQPLSPIDLERGMAQSAPEPAEAKGWRKVVTEARGNNPRRTQWKPDEISITIRDDASPSSSPTSSSHLTRLSSPRSTNGQERS